MPKRDPINSLLDRFDALVTEHGGGAGLVAIALFKRRLAEKGTMLAPQPVAKAKGKGRPAGSKNKPKAPSAGTQAAGDEKFSPVPVAKAGD